ncbi:unnamed protein product [Danaus chrysippus]|uniref:(African queen) hypothetical protein n=1 Tax=Danaus chrysippus TaxID=151541 RepID=A0A8J2MEG9_9NEOP|nr:unnamed protein product [Danaus chrysippus]
MLLHEPETDLIATTDLVATTAAPDKPIVCESCYVVMECAYTAMFAWMLIEGIYIRYLVSKQIMKSFHFKIYCWLAWGATIFFTTVWALSTRSYHADETSVKVVTILTPLLGIINILNMIDISIYSPTWKFALWLYVSHFLRSFQGCFLSLFYCIFNGEVRKTLKRKIKALRFWKCFSWECFSWECFSWDCFSWDCFSWDCFSWDCFSWECFSWECFSWKWFSWKRPVNEERPVVNHILSDELMDSVPPPPFFRIDADGNPTTRLECGCKPMIEAHHCCRCALERECDMEMTECCDVLCDESAPMPPCCMQQRPSRMVVYPEIHPEPQRRQRSEPIEIIEMIETTV